MADGTSDGATVGAVAGLGISAIGAVLGNPALIAAGGEITATSLSIGTGADVTSTILKTADAVFFDGFSDAALSQALSTAVNVISGRVLNSLTAKAVTRTGLSSTLFRSTQSGQFISNVQGFTITAARDATEVVIGLGY